MIDRYFIINIFDEIGKYIPQFKNYLEYLFEIKISRTVENQQVVLPFDELTTELFYPKHSENWANNQIETKLTSEAATAIMMELTDTRKATSKHFSFIKVMYSISEATRQMKQYGIGGKSNNSLSESGFTAFKIFICKIWAHYI